MNRKNRQREAGWILALTEAEAEAAAWEAKAKFWQAVHRERTNEALRVADEVRLDITPDTTAWDRAMLGPERIADWERDLLAREVRP
jgi:hypothetical protein